MPDSFGLDLSSPFGGGSSDTGSSFTPKTGNLPSVSDFFGRRWALLLAPIRRCPAQT
jgi:hypothetical protein